MHFAFRNLIQRKTRTLLSVAAIASQIAFVVLLVGLSTGTLQEVGDRIENMQTDIILLPPGGQFILSMSTAVMPLRPVRAALEATDGVLVATPVVITTTTQFGGYGMVFGIEPHSYAEAGRGAFSFEEGQAFQSPNDIVVDRRLARAQQIEVGQDVHLLNSTFRVSGIIRDGAGVRIYLPLATLQDLMGRHGKASAFFVRTRTPEGADRVMAALKRNPAFKGYKLIASEQYAELLGRSTFGVREFIAAVSVLAVVFGFLVISVVMYTAIVERTKQIGILKSLGAGGFLIVRAFLIEAVMVALLGTPAGLLAAWGARLGLQFAYPTLIITFTLEWVLFATAIALVASFLGALYPAVRAARLDPVVALGFE